MCKESQIEQVRNSILSCTRCILCPNAVPGSGNSNADIMLVGEAPGENEAELQEPFVGPAGQLLNKMLEDAGLDRQDLYITNTVKGRPYNGPKNRAPTEDEIRICRGWLWREIQIVNPKIIVTLGKIATYTLLHSKLKKTFKMGTIVGTQYSVDYCSSIFIPVYHPSFVLQYGKSYFQQCVEIFESLKGLV